MIDFLGSPWLAYAVLAVVTAAARLRCGSWFAPAAFVGLVWTFFTGASLLVADYPVPGRGMWMLVVLIVAIQLGALIAHEIRPQRDSTAGLDRTIELESLIVPCRKWGLICAALAFVGCVYFLFESLNEFGLLFTPLGVLEVGAKWTLLRNEDTFEPWAVRILITWFHPAALLGGILFACSRNRADRAIAILTLLPAAAYGAFTGARSALLLGLTCWIGGYVASLLVRNHGQVPLFTVKRVSLLLAGAGLMIAMFGAVDTIRDSSWSQTFTFDLRQQKLANYVFAPPAAFADWYAHFDAIDPQWGARTFAGEFDLLHLKTRTVGTYLEKSNILGTESTNIYTIFRGFIEDFTGYGAVLVAMLLGGLAGFMYGSISHNSRRAIFWLSMFFASTLYSPLISLFSFNGATLAWVVGWMVLTRPKSFPLFLRLPPAPKSEASLG